MDTYNAELRDDGGFIGDRASNQAFRSSFDDIREQMRQIDADPIGDLPTKDIGKKKLDQLMAGSGSKAAPMLLGTVETFTHEFATVIHQFLRLRAWRGTQRIVVGGGLRASQIGELAIGCATVAQADNKDIDLQPIRHDPDGADLIGCIHLAPSWVFSGHDSILAVDLGGSKMRAAVVERTCAKPLSCRRARSGRPICGVVRTKADRDGAVGACPGCSRA